MQPCSTILGIIEMRLRGISYDDCRRRYGVGNSAITLIMDRYTAHGVPLEELKKLSATDVESTFYPPDNIRRKAEDVMPNYEAIYERIMCDGSKANLYFMWLKYKQEHPQTDKSIIPTATGRSGSGAPPCAGTGCPATSAPAGFPARPHSRPSAPRYDPPRPRCASDGR